MALYQQIRDCAGSKMLREAELMIAYEKAKLYDEEGCTDAADSIIQTWYAEYPPLTQETPMTRMSHEQVVSIDDNEIKRLPYVYVYMLQTICYSDESLTMPLVTPVTHLSPMKTKEQIINRKINISGVTDWCPLHPNISNKYAFDYVFLKWYKDNYDADMPIY